MKKVILVLVALLATWQSSLAHDFSAVAPTGQTLYYTIAGSGVSVSDWSNANATGNLTIPSSVTHNGITYAVTGIRYEAFKNYSGLTSISIPNSVTSIGDDAFWGCTNLSSVSIPSSVTSIGSWAFRRSSGLTSIVVENGNSVYDSRGNCNAIIETATNTLIAGCQNTTIPSSVTSIGSSAFYDCTGLTSITIPSSVTSIGGNAFLGCTGLTSITIPSSVTSIGSGAFWGCTGLTSLTIGNSVTSIGPYSFRDCTGLTTVNFNADSCTIAGSNAYISDRAFNDCPNITSFNFGSNVKVIPSYLCYGMTGLTSITIPNSVTSIGEKAFYGCTGLTAPVYNNTIFAQMPTTYAGSYSIPDGITTIRGNAFDGCNGLSSITIPSTVTYIGSNAFSNCRGLTTVNFNADSCTFAGSSYSPFNGCTYISTFNFGSNVKVIPSYLCYGLAGLTSVTIPNSVVSIGDDAFYGCTGLTSVTIPNSVTRIGTESFRGCTGLTSVTIPNSVVSIDSRAFSGCTGLTSVTISNSVTSIGSGAFSDCTGLTSVTIPSSVTSIGSRAFWDCTGLTTVNFNADSCTLDGSSSYDRAFYGCNNITSFNFGSNVKVIPSYLCYGMTGLTSVTIGNSVASINTYAFGNCSGLTTVNFNADSCTYAGGMGWNGALQRVFHDCNNITSFNFGSNVKVIPSYLCYGMTGLTSVTIPESVTSIGNDAFENCTGLTAVNFNAANCTLAGSSSSSSSPFYGCNNITSFNFGSNVKVIPSYLCYGMTGLTSVTIPDSVISLGYQAFWGCTGLTTVNFNADSCSTVSSTATFSGCSNITSFNFGSNVKIIPDYLCKNLTGLSSVNIPNSVTSIGRSAFEECTGLTSVTIPDSVVSIGISAFWRCSNLAEVTIGKSLDSICHLAFGDCTSLYYITSYAPNPPVCLGSTFSGVPSGSMLFVPCDYFDQYQTASPWSGFNVRSISGYRLTLEGNGYYSGGHATMERESCDGPAVLHAFPDECYRFIGWSDGSTENPYTLTPNYDMTIRPQFSDALPFSYGIAYYDGEASTFNDLYNNNPEALAYAIRQYSNRGEVQVTEMRCDSIVVLTAVTSYYYGNYRFSQWHDGSTENPRTVRLTSDTFFVAIFSECVQHEVNISYDYDQGYVYTQRIGCSEAQLEAHADCGYAFSHWSDGSTENPRTLVLTQDTSLTAYFQDLQLGYQVTVLPSDSALGWTVGSRRYSDCHYDRTESGGFRAEMYAIPFGGSVFNGWSNGSMSNPLNIIATSDTVITALFSTHTASDSVYVHDTVTLTVHDTTVITLHDTTIVTRFDTVTLHSTDTLYITHTDTLAITLTDTLWMTRVDTLWLHDTVYIHDTVYVGVDDVEAVNVKLYQRGGQIVLEGAEGNTVTLYDVSGRLLATKQDDYSTMHFDVPASGAYMIKVGRHPARKIVVVK
ncbi:MAG: leucine-rich repeat domain-containing protein [Bacteroidales bacterium]|nr:leucine-rich repeat domain-containing protein [Bacteroidales bacterium]